jgi:hypothetical protein
MDKRELKGCIAGEALIFLGVISLLAFITRLWPILLLVMAVIPICVLRLLFLRVKTATAIVPAPAQPEPPPVETELSIVVKAFGLLQQRITEQLDVQYPGARWVWGVPNAIEPFKMGEELIIFLNKAGGYQKAKVTVHNLLFKGLLFLTAELPPATHAEPHKENDTADDTMPDDVPINYGRLAFEWVDANIADINARYNESIAQNQTEMLIPSDELPHPDSWLDVCEELIRNGFDAADFCEDGILVRIAL